MKKTVIFLSIFVLNSLGQLFAQQGETFMLNLQSPTYPTNFNMIGNGYWDQTYNDSDFTFFKSQIYSFSHLIEGEGSSYGGSVWNGFTVCNSGDSTNHNPNGIWVPDYEWGCMAGGGIKTDAEGNIMFDNQGDVITELGIEYLVGFWNNLTEPEYWDLGYHPFLDEPTHCLQIILDDDEEYEAVGVYVCNHPYSYYVAKEGGGISSPLNQPGDYFKLIIHGLNPDGSESGKSVEHFLAKFEDNQLQQSRKWEWIDLSSLGEVGGFYCTMKSTDENEWGPLTPVYFCMDKLQVKIKTIGINDYMLDNVQIYSYQKNIYIKSTDFSSNFSSLKVEITDILGRGIYRSSISSAETVIPLNAPRGVYFVKVVSQTGAVKVKKVEL